VASVRPRTRPPSSSTVIDSFAASTAAVGSDAVTTVSGRLAGSASAISCGVKPSSMKTVSASPSWCTAAAAIRRFSGTRRVVRMANVVSNRAVSTG
jgi:hypothetical protein